MSYNSLGNELGMTAKSVKARVKKMESSGVIDSFIVKVNPHVLGYSKFCLLILRNNNKNPDDEKHIRNSISLLGEILYTGQVLGNISTYKLALRKEAEEKIDLLINLIGKDRLIETQTSVIPNVRDKMTYVDFMIIRSLLNNPRTEISEIAEKISFSSKTVARRLEKMMEDQVLDFTLQINFTAIRGYIVSVVSATIDKGYYTKVLEKTYAEFKDSFCIYSPMLSQQDVVYWLYFSKDVFALDSIVKRMESYPGIKKTEVYIPISIEYHKGIVTKEIERILLNKEGQRIWNQGLSNIVTLKKRRT